MTHAEYVSRLAVLTDGDASEVLAHVGGCATCASDARRTDAALARLEPRRRSIGEEIARWAAVAAILAVVAFGLRSDLPPTAGPEAATRYHIVGDASGVVAYTPAGIVIGTAARSNPKEIVR